MSEAPQSPDQPPRAEKEYLIFLDESERKGAYYSNFYGGVIVGARHYERITRALEEPMTGDGGRGLGVASSE